MKVKHWNIFLQVPLITSSALIGHQILDMQFHGDVQGKIPRKWLLYGLTVVGTRWLTERWKTISALVLPESSLLMVCFLKYDLPYYNRYILIAYIQADRLMDSTQLILKMGNLLNSLIFLKQGLYPTLIHRVLRLQTRMQSPDQSKSADLSTLTRELLGHCFAVSSLLLIWNCLIIFTYLSGFVDVHFATGQCT